MDNKIDRDKKFYLSCLQDANDIVAQYTDDYEIDWKEVKRVAQGLFERNRGYEYVQDKQ